MGAGNIIVIDPDDQQIAAFRGEVQQPQVAGVDNVEIAGDERHAGVEAAELIYLADNLADPGARGTARDTVHGRYIVIRQRPLIRPSRREVIALLISVRAKRAVMSSRSRTRPCR